MFFMVYYIGFLIFYNKLTNLAQKFKNLDYMRYMAQNKTLIEIQFLY